MEGSPPKVGSFCGALSAFSGTIGDIADMQLGSATEDSVLDEKEGHKSRRRPPGCGGSGRLEHEDLGFSLLMASTNGQHNRWLLLSRSSTQSSKQPPQATILVSSPSH